MILSKKELLAAIRSKQIQLSPFDARNVGACSIDFRLGNRFRTFKRKPTVFARDEKYPDDATADVTLAKNQTLVLQPGEFALGLTLERLKLSNRLCAHIEGRSRFARMGLMVHVSSALIQPGVDNHQVLEIVNLSPSPLALEPGVKIGQFVFSKLSSPAAYTGGYAKQTHF